MEKQTIFLWQKVYTQPLRNIAAAPTARRPWVCPRCDLSRQILGQSYQQRRTLISPRILLRRRLAQPQQRRHQSNPADIDPNFRSVVDNPPTLIRSNRKHNPFGLALLAAIPLTAFVLGCWQVQRLSWKTDLIAKFEDRLVRDPLPLPPVIDPDAIHDFDYRRVLARGRWRHEKEMLIGPRLHDGEDGYLLITPLDRSEEFPELQAKGVETTVLVNRGWISKSHASPATRPESRSTEVVTVEGLLREPWKRNSFTPSNKPEEGKWYFPDVYEMASFAGTQPVWVEETMRPDLIASYEREAKGIPIGRPPEVNLRNNHLQYIFTWFSLSLATSIMLWMVVKRPVVGRGSVRRNTGW